MFYLQLIWLNVSATISVILPPGLQEKHDITAAFSQRVSTTSKRIHTGLWDWLIFSIGNQIYMWKSNKEQSQCYESVWHSVNTEFLKALIKDGYPNPSSTHCLSPAESCGSIHNVWLSKNSFNTQREAWTANFFKLLYFMLVSCKTKPRQHLCK